MTYDKDTAKEILRNAVLNALDAAAKEIFGERAAGHKGGVGAMDEDLPRLFPAIDQQLDVLSTRFNHPLYEGWVGSEKYMAERRHLQMLGLPVVDDIALRKD
ncbi:MAG: hypothetical protein E5W57_04080 [Mesorhizobium sp.]|nr:MAG: hypothetical protein E5W57_04080 [Mesorhizobium sp.]